MLLDDSIKIPTYMAEWEYNLIGKEVVCSNNGTDLYKGTLKDVIDFVFPYKVLLEDSGEEEYFMLIEDR